MKNRRYGVTILELMMILVIMGIVGVIAISSVTTTSEKNVGRNAENSLFAIQKMQKRYFLRTGVFYVVDAAIVDPQHRNENITRNLKVTLENNDFNYNIVPVVVGHPELGYRVSAIRRANVRRSCVAAVMTLLFNQTEVTKTGCRSW